ncbi:MAG: Ig domain-containing protein [Ruminococcaceae bacterium]|nr:Ig domain-containing protein [Oscillospiraceae bacterium]
MKGSSLLAISANFRYGLTTILFTKPAATIPATSVSLNTTSRTMIVENIYTLKATVFPSNTTDQSITWSSSNTGVASVSSEGKVKAISAGTATITAKTSNGKKATCKITVKKLILENYPETKIPTFTCITGKPPMGFDAQEDFIMYAYAFDIESHTDYEAYLVHNGWVLEYENVADDSSYYASGYAKGDTRVLVMAAFEDDITIISYENKSISVTSSINGNRITVTPKNLPKNSSVVLACYNGKELTDLQFYTYNNETSITFSTTKSYNKIKIFLWESSTSLIPLCTREVVPLQ